MPTELVLLTSPDTATRWRWVVEELLAQAGSRASLRTEHATTGHGVWQAGHRILESEELDRIFRTLSLAAELDGPLDVHGRCDETMAADALASPWISLRARELFAPDSPPKPLRVILTHDVDRTTGWEVTSLAKAGIRSLIGRNNRWLGLGKALRPGHMLKRLGQLLALEEHEGVRGCYFFIAGPAGLGRYDSRTDIRWPSARESLRQILASGARIGLHGSYHARDRDLYTEEAQRIAQVAGQPLRLHRNHYLRLDPRRFCGQLQAAGLELDMSIGYVGRTWFRAGVCDAWRPWDFERQRPAELFCLPLLFMENTAEVECPESLLERLESGLREATRAGGTVSILIHPEVFAVDARWYGIYREMIQVCRNLGAEPDTDPCTLLDELKGRRWG